MASYVSLRVGRRATSPVSVKVNGSDRIEVYDQGGSPNEIVNEPDDSPPAGLLPVYQVDSTMQLVEFFAIGTPIDPVPLPDTIVVTIVSPPGPVSVGAGTSIEFIATATINGVDASSLVQWSSDLDGKLGMGAKLNINDLSVGGHVITATVEGWAAVGTDTELVTIFNVGTPPVVEIVSPTGGTFYLNAPIQFVATAIDAEDGVISDLVRWYTSASAEVLYQGQKFVTTTLPLGAQTISARCSDSDGDEGQDTVQVSVVVDEEVLIPLSDNVTVGSQFYGTISINTVSSPVVQ